VTKLSISGMQCRVVLSKYLVNRASL